MIYASGEKNSYWIENAFPRETAKEVLDDLIMVVNDPHGTGYEAHRDKVTLAGKTGTAELKVSKEDTSGTELGWFAVMTADADAERPILLVSMVEDVKGRGGSGYVVKKADKVLDAWLVE